MVELLDFPKMVEGYGAAAKHEPARGTNMDASVLCASPSCILKLYSFSETSSSWAHINPKTDSFSDMELVQPDL